MAYEPLEKDTVYGGVIYLEGETEYPKELDESLKAKKSKPVRAASPIFQSSRFDSTAAGTGAAQESQPLTPPPPVEPNGETGQEGGQEPQTVVDELPTNLPYRENFVEAGYNDLSTFLELVDQNRLTEVDNIGSARAIEVADWVHNNIQR